MDRRQFMGGAAMLAAGAVAGIKNRVKTHGPVVMSLRIWTPFTVPCMLTADPDRDIFRIRMMPKNIPEIYAEVSLSKVREAVEGRAVEMGVRTWNESVESKERLRAFVCAGDLNFVPPGYQETSPIKLRLEDVRRVL